jgi:hypothetical protein
MQRLEVSGAVRPLYGSLGVKGLIRPCRNSFIQIRFFSKAQQHLFGQGLLSIETTRTHSDTQHSVGLLCTSDQPDAEGPTWQHTTLSRDWHLCLPARYWPAMPASQRPQTAGLWTARPLRSAHMTCTEVERNVFINVTMDSGKAIVQLLLHTNAQFKYYHLQSNGCWLSFYISIINLLVPELFYF